MNIMIIGATGLIGKQLAQLLHNQGHTLVLAARTYQSQSQSSQKCSQLYFDYLQNEAQWREFQTSLINVELVINAAGIYEESKKGRLSKYTNKGQLDYLPYASNTM